MEEKHSNVEGESRTTYDVKYLKTNIQEKKEFKHTLKKETSKKEKV